MKRRWAPAWGVLWVMVGGSCSGPEGVPDDDDEGIEVSEQKLTISGTDVDVSNVMGHEAEVAIDINPRDPTNMVIAGHSPGFATLETFFTVDSGRTWTLVSLGTAQDGLGAGTRFDPVLAFDERGNVYVAYGVTVGTNTTLLVATSTDGGRTYSRFTTLATTANVGTLPGNDKWGIATGPDPTVRGRQDVYVSWTQNITEMAGNDQRIVVSRSIDAGQTFSAPTIINDGSISGTENNNLFAEPAVGPAGEVYVVWHRIAAGQVVIDVSTDGGVTFGTDRLVTTSGAGFLTLIPAQPDRGTSVNPAIDVDRSGGRFNGRLYVSYVDDSDATAGIDMDVFVRTSDDGGITWSAPVRMSDSATNDQFMPWLDVDQVTGTLVAVWFDARNDPNNQLVQLISASSRDGGATFRPNIVVSDGQSNESTSNPSRNVGANYLEYLGTAGHNCEASAVWPDNSTNPANLDYFSDHVDNGCDSGLSQLCLLGASSVRLQERVRLVNRAGGFGRVGNGGRSITDLGERVRVGDVASVARVVLRERARVGGDLVTGGSLSRDDGALVTGTTLERQTVILPRLAPFLADFPALGRDVVVARGRTVTLAPGAYRHVTVRDDGRLRLSAGTYFFGSLVMESGSTVRLDKRQGEILIRVMSTFVYRGRFIDPASPFAGAIVVYQGDRPAELETRFEGTLIAPRGKLELESVPGGHEGAFFARDLLVRARAQLTCRPYEFTWSPAEEAR
jgi:hypothetical protein